LESERQKAQLAIAQDESQLSKLGLETAIAVAAQQKQEEVERVRSEASAARERLAQEVGKANALLGQDLALEASRKSVEIAENAAAADGKGLDILRSRAEIAALPAGQHVLFPTEAFELDRARLIREAEFFKQTYSDKRLQALSDLIMRAGASQGELQQLRAMMAHFTGIAVTQHQPDGVDEGREQRPPGSAEADVDVTGTDRVAGEK
jgi:hypothetical protein